MAKLTKVQKHVMAQVKALDATSYLSMPWKLARTVDSLHTRGLVSYHVTGGRIAVVPAGRFSYGTPNAVEYVAA